MDWDVITVSYKNENLNDIMIKNFPNNYSIWNTNYSNHIGEKNHQVVSGCCKVYKSSCTIQYNVISGTHGHQQLQFFSYQAKMHHLPHLISQLFLVCKCYADQNKLLQTYKHTSKDCTPYNILTWHLVEIWI